MSDVVEHPVPERARVERDRAEAHALAERLAGILDQPVESAPDVDAADLYAELQARLLPPPAVTDGDVHIASLYQPGEQRRALGGDFSDVVQTPSGALSTVVGDVTGNGPAAIALGVVLRAAWRALALEGVAPAEAVRVLDTLLRSERDSDEQLVTVCCAEITPERRTLSVVCAGHPAPILSDTERTGLVAAPTGLLLGAPVRSRTWECTAVALPSRWALLFYTDGLTEALVDPHATDRVGQRRLADYVAAQEPVDTPDPAALLQRLHETVRTAGGPLGDDTAMLFLRRRPL